MENEKLAIINRIAEIIGTSGNEVLGYYAKWYIYQSIRYMLLGVLFIYANFTLPKLLIKEELENWQLWSIRGIFIVIGVFIIAVNLGDLLSPEGIAVHQLLKDLRQG